MDPILFGTIKIQNELHATVRYNKSKGLKRCPKGGPEKGSKWPKMAKKGVKKGVPDPGPHIWSYLSDIPHIN